MTGLRIDSFGGRAAHDSLMFSRTRHFSFASSAGRMRIESARLGVQGMKLFCVRSTGHEVALAEEAHLNVLLPLRGKVCVATASGDHAARPGEFLVFPPNERRTVAVPDDGLYEAILLAVPHPVRGVGQFGVAAATKLGGTVASGALAAELIDLLVALRGTAHPSHVDNGLAIVAARLEDHLLLALRQVMVPARQRRAQAGTIRQLGIAEEFMRLNIGRPLRMADIAAAAGLSVRGLQAAFQRHRGTTPHEALSRLRLEEARVKLLNGRAGDRVTDVAMLMGFTHLGRFSQTYAHRFGESPSASLRRARSG